MQLCDLRGAIRSSEQKGCFSALPSLDRLAGKNWQTLQKPQTAARQWQGPTGLFVSQWRPHWCNIGVSTYYSGESTGKENEHEMDSGIIYLGGIIQPVAVVHQQLLHAHWEAMQVGSRAFNPNTCGISSGRIAGSPCPDSCHIQSDKRINSSRLF